MCHLPWKYILMMLSMEWWLKGNENASHNFYFVCILMIEKQQIFVFCLNIMKEMFAMKTNKFLKCEMILESIWKFSCSLHKTERKFRKQTSNQTKKNKNHSITTQNRFIFLRAKRFRYRQKLKMGSCQVFKCPNNLNTCLVLVEKAKKKLLRYMFHKLPLYSHSFSLF